MGSFSLTRVQRDRLRRQLKRTQDARIYRRTLAVLEHGRGRPIAHIARDLEVDRRSVHRWIEAYCKSPRPDALVDNARPGRPPRWDKDCSRWLQTTLTVSPRELGYFAVNWTVPLLQEVLQLCSGQRFSDDTIRRELGQIGYVWKRTRYVLEPDPEREKKTQNSPQHQAFPTTNRVAGGG